LFHFKFFELCQQRKKTKEETTLSKKTRKPVWNINVLDEFDRELTTWGVSQAPLIYKDFVIVAPQGKEGGVVAFHKKQERNYGSIPD